ncbi:MAG: hypothetical protein AB203_02940 [Parcubacteria bacterium C7867-008]|nr:MAG: hypothetical protein AB203_02940 [Parcubacteria bacterium C7867-008]
MSREKIPVPSVGKTNQELSPFESFKKKHKPLKEAFNPEEELANISQLSREEKGRALRGFKEKLATQHAAWAAFRTDIENRIKENPDVAGSVFNDTLVAYADAYGFTKEQITLAAEIFEDYLATRAAVLKTRETYPDDRELVQKLTGIRVPEGTTVKVSIGAMNIDIVTNTRYMNMVYAQSKEMDEPIEYGGLAWNRNVDGEHVPYNLISDEIEGDSVRVHEVQHQTNHLYRDFFEMEIDDIEMRSMRLIYDMNSDPTVRRTGLESYVSSRVTSATRRAKDEILAYAADGTSAENTFKILTKKDGKAYDYLKDLREEKSDDPIWLDVVPKKVVTEYEGVVKSGTEVFATLAHKFPRDEVIALLSAEPLEDWSRFMTRMYPHKSQFSNEPRKVLRELVEKSPQMDRERAAKIEKLKQTAKENTLPALGTAAIGTALGAFEAHQINAAYETHSDRNNVEFIDADSAYFNVVYASSALPVNKETIGHADALILDVRTVHTKNEAEDFVAIGAQSHERLSAIDTALMEIHGIRAAGIPSRYLRLIEEALEHKIPIYFLDIETPEAERAEDRSNTLKVAESAVGVGLVARGVKELNQEKQTRRSFLSGFSQLLAGSYLGSRIPDGALAAAEQYEPDTRAFAHPLKQELASINSQIHPETHLALDLETQDALVAQKAHTLGKWLGAKLGHKPSLALVLDKKHIGLKRELEMSEEERLLQLRKDLGPDLWQQSDIIRVSGKHFNLKSKVFKDDSLMK